MNERKYYRIDRHFMVSFRRLNSEEPYQMSQTRDISEDGLAVIAGSRFQVGDKLQMLVAFPFRFGERVGLTGKVVVCRDAQGMKGEYRVGIQFVDFDEATRRDLVAFVETCKQQDR